MKNILYLTTIAFVLSCGTTNSESEGKVDINQEEITAIKKTTELSPMVMPHIFENREEMISISENSFVEMDKLIEMVVNLKSAPVSEKEMINIDNQFNKLMQTSSSIHPESEPFFIDYVMPIQEIKDQFIGVNEQQQFNDVKGRMKKYLGSFYLLFSIQDQY